MNELKITYLVDTENINTCWINIFKNMNKQDQMLLFYTENTPYLSYEYMNDLFELERRPEMIRCKTGRNALDFQLVSHLGYLIHNDKSQSYVIVTKDKAYRVVAEYWTEKGFSVECCTPEQIEKQMKKSGAVIGGRMPSGRKAAEEEKPKPEAGRSVEEETETMRDETVSKKGGVMELLGLGRKKKKDGKKDAKKDLKKEVKKEVKKKDASKKNGNKKETAKKDAVKKDAIKKDTIKKESTNNERVLKSMMEKQTRQPVKKELPQNPEKRQEKKQEENQKENQKEKSKNVRAELGKLIPKELKQEDKKLLADLESFIKENGSLDQDVLHEKFAEQWGAEKGEKLYQLLKGKMHKLVA